MELEGRVALVTGGSSGIGEACARRLAREGAAIGLLARSEEKLERVVRDIEADGGQALALEADVSQPQQVRQAVERVAQRWGRLDLVVANAGINGVWAPLEELEPEEWDQTLAINLKGTFLTVKYAVPLLKKRGGAVVVVSSINGTRIFSNTGATAYSCSKAGQVAFAKMVALELAKHRVRVNVVCPGWIQTNIDESTEKRDLDREREPVEYPEGQVPLTDGAPGSAEQVAEAVLFLCSDRASHVSGTELYVDGAQSLLQG